MPLPVTTPIKNKKRFDKYEREFQIRDEEDVKDKTMILEQTYLETSSQQSKGDSNHTESP